MRWHLMAGWVAAVISTTACANDAGQGGTDVGRADVVSADSGDGAAQPDVVADAAQPDVVADTPAGVDAPDASDAMDTTGADTIDAGGDTGPDAPAPASGWTSLPAVPGGVIQENAVVALAGRVYVIGGMRDLFGIAAEVHRYDPGSASWETVAPLPSPVHHPNAATVDGAIVVVGALESYTFAAAAVAWRYDLATNTWETVTPMPAARRRGASAVAVVGGAVYVVGGYRGGAVSEVDRYDATTDTWEALGDFPIAADHIVAAAVDGVIYAIGGRDSSGALSDVESTVFALDPAVGTWQARAPMPTARAGTASDVIDGKIYVVGGEGNREAGSNGVFPQTERYDPATNTWTSLEPMKTPRHGTGAVGLGGVLYVPAGADAELFGAVDVFEAYVP